MSGRGVLKLLALSLTLIGLPGYGVAPHVTGVYEEVEQGYIVRFTVHNMLRTGVVSRWSIATADATDPVGPLGWRIYQTYRDIQWSASDPAYWIPEMQVLGGFAFTAQNPPGTLGWWILGGGNGWVGSVTPVPIPEPSSLLALGLAASGLGGVALRKRRR